VGATKHGETRSPQKIEIPSHCRAIQNRKKHHRKQVAKKETRYVAPTNQRRQNVARKGWNTMVGGCWCKVSYY